MGWTFTSEKVTKQKEREFLEREIIFGDSEIVHMSKVGNIWYAAVKTKISDLSRNIWVSKDGETVTIGLVIMTSHRGGYGFKVMGEEVGPNYYDAPMKMLAMLSRLKDVPESKYALAWRESVVKTHDAKREIRKISLGDKVITKDTLFFGGVGVNEFRVTEYQRRGKSKRAFWNEKTGLVRLGTNHLIGAKIIKR